MIDILQYNFHQREGTPDLSPQELHFFPQLLCDFDQLNFYKKVSDRRIIIYITDF